MQRDISLLLLNFLLRRSESDSYFQNVRMFDEEVGNKTSGTSKVIFFLYFCAKRNFVAFRLLHLV
jgi:hypothetical protein